MTIGIRKNCLLKENKFEYFYENKTNPFVVTIRVLERFCGGVLVLGFSCRDVLFLASKSSSTGMANKTHCLSPKASEHVSSDES